MLQLGSSNSIPTGSALSIAGTLDMGGYNQTVRTLSGAGLVTSSGAGTLVLTVSDNGEATTYSGVIENGSAGSVGLTKTGIGTLVLSGSSTYTGATSINQGVLDVRHSNGLGVSSLTTVSSGAALQLRGGISIGSLALRLTGTGVSSDGALRNMSGNNSWGGLVTLLTSTTRINSDAGVLTLGGASSISSTNIGLQVGGSSGQVTVSGVMSLGSGTLSKDGGSTLLLGGVNVYSGSTSVSGGVLRLSNSSGLGSSSLTSVSSGATVELVGGVSVGNALSLSGSGVSNGGALRSVSGTNSWTGSIMVNSSATRINSDADVLDIVGVMSGSGGVRYGGAGTVEVSGVSTYTGVTEVSSGVTLLLGNSNVLSSSSNVLFSGGRLSSDGKNVSVGTLSVSSVSELLLGSGSHTVQFSGGGTFSFTRLMIKGWQGVYGGSGSSGSEGRVYVGSSGGVLSREQLDQIQFMGSDNVTTYYALQLSSGEVVPGLSTLSSPTGNSNVQVTSGATSGGSWSVTGSGITTMYTFTPSADNANINVSDITNRLRGTVVVATPGRVRIVTTNGVGTQVGNVNFVVGVSAQNWSTSRYSLQVVAGGDIVVGGSLSLGGESWNQTLNYGYDIDFSAGGNVLVNSTIVTSGQGAATSSIVYSNGGNVSLSASGYVRVAGSINTSGGLNSSNPASVNSNGGWVSITGVGGVTMGADITTFNGRSGMSGYGANGGITISSGNGVLSSGGGSGVNDGQVGGLLRGGDFVKSGVGVFVIKGSNLYTGNTSVSGGVLQLGSSNSIPTGSALTLNSGTLNTGGFSQTVASISITDNSIIELTSAIHTLTSTAIGSFASGKILTINGWEGTYAAPGLSGTKGKIIINGTALSATILGQIKFYNAASLFTHSAIQLATKEVVAGN